MADTKKPFQKLSTLSPKFSRNTRHAVLIQNAGVFDALTYCIASQCIDNKSFCSLFHQRGPKEFVKYIDVYLKFGDHNTTYVQRNKLLEKKCIRKNVGGFSVINLAWSIEETVEMILEELPSVVETFACSCPKKQQHKPKHHVLLQGTLTSNISACANCKTIINVQRQPSETIYLKREFTESVLLENIEQTITIDQKKFALVCVIERQVENEFSNCTY